MPAGAQPRGRIWGICPPPEIFKALHSNFDICKLSKNKDESLYLIIFKKSYWNFSLSYW